MIRLANRLVARYSHLSWALADQAMISGVNFLTGVLLARYLGLEGFGRFTLAWMVVLFLSSIQHALIVAPMMSIGPKQSDAERPTYFGAVMVQGLGFAALVFVLILVGTSMSATLFPEWHTAGLALPLAAVALAAQLQDFLRRYFFVIGRDRVAFANDTVRSVGQLIALVWIFQVSGRDTVNALWAMTVAAIAAALSGAFFVEKPALLRTVLGATTVRHWNFSKWMAGWALLQWTSFNLFILAAGPLLGATAVGAIRAAQNLMGVTHVFLLGLENVVPIRAASHYHRDGVLALFRYIKRIAWAGELATAAVVMVFAAAPEFWLDLVYGDEFAGHGALIRWYAVIYLVMFLGIPLGAGLRALEQTRTYFVAGVLGTVAGLVAVYPLLTWFGTNGAMAGTLMVQVIFMGLFFRRFRQKVRELESQ